MTDDIEETKSSKGVSRRQFIAGTVGGVVMGAAATAAAGSLGIPRTVQAATPLAKTRGIEADPVMADFSSDLPSSWDLSADVVVVGGGGSGLPAALAAKAQGATVLVVEANYDVGGHAIVSGGHAAYGAGSPPQIKYGIVDSPAMYYSDLTDWTITETSGVPDSRYNDRAFCHMYVDNCVATYNLLVASGEAFTDVAPTSGGTDQGISSLRVENNVYTGAANKFAPNAAGGTNYIRPLEAGARKLGIQFLLNYHMDAVIRSSGEYSPTGRVVGITAHYTGGRIPPGSGTPLTSYADDMGMPGNIHMTQAEVNIWANKGVILCTGGHSSNVNFRRAFDYRLTDVYSNAGAPYSYQDASGELAALAVGASLWGTVNQTMEVGKAIAINSNIGVKYNYGTWQQTSPVFAFAGATGLSMSNWQDAIIVNQVGQRIYNELNWRSYAAGMVPTEVVPYTPFSVYNMQYITSSTKQGTYDGLSNNALNAALGPNAFSQPPDYGAGPVWAIFDSAAVTREKWAGVTYPYVDTANGMFFAANDLTTLAAATIGNPYQAAPMDGPTLNATVTRYNTFVDSGTDLDFGKTKPAYKINTPPYYCAWVTPQCHDTRSGLRPDQKMRVLDWNGDVIPGLFCGGEVAGGIVQHGLARCGVGGYVAGTNAAGGYTPI